MPPQTNESPETRLATLEGRVMLLLWAALILFLALLANNYAQGLAGSLLGTSQRTYILVKRDALCPDGRPSVTFLAFTGRNMSDSAKAKVLGIRQDVTGNAVDAKSWADTRLGLCIKE